MYQKQSINKLRRLDEMRRPAHSKVVPPAQTAVPVRPVGERVLPATPRKSVRRITPLWVWIVAGLAAVGIATVVGVVLGSRSVAQRPVQLPTSAVSKSKFPLYHPAKLPDGLRFDEQHVESKDDMTVTRFNSKEGSLVLTQQPRPENVDLKQIDSAETYANLVGTVYVLKGEQGKVQLLVDTEKTWLLVSVDKKVGLATAKAFVSDLQPVTN